MKKISATYLFPGNQPPLKNGILVCEDDGTVLDVIDTGGHLHEQSQLEHYSGILVPGFVNTHCHLELSHLKGKIPEKTGLGGFLAAINQWRNAEDEKDGTAIKKADFWMQTSGIAAVGDISNSWSTLETKQQSNLFYHTFVEAFGFHPSRAERAFSLAEYSETMFKELGLPASVTPHSPYSVSDVLFRKIKEKAQNQHSILSIHNQESLAEKQFFKEAAGPIFNHLQQTLGLDVSHWKPTGKSSLETTLHFLPKENQLLLVHNTFTEQADISVIKKHRHLENTFFVLCPRSNLYIENHLPPVRLFKKEKLNICLGTDSLASNHNLSLLQEMITLQHHFPEITIQELIEWACFNGAKALKIDPLFGSFEPGKKPGINLITGVDLKNLKFTPNSKVKVLQGPVKKRIN